MDTVTIVVLVTVGFVSLVILVVGFLLLVDHADVSEKNTELVIETGTAAWEDLKEKVFTEQVHAGLRQTIEADLNEAEAKAWDSLSRYKFVMFGYWAGVWVHLNRVGGFSRPNPWTCLVSLAKAKKINGGKRWNIQKLEVGSKEIPNCYQV